MSSEEPVAAEHIEMVVPSPKDVKTSQKPVAAENSEATRDFQIAHDKQEYRVTLVLIVLEIVSIICFSQFTDYTSALTGSTANQGAASHKDYYPMFQDVHVMIFVGFGFLMTFMKRYAFSSVGMNFFLAAITIQYAILINGFWHCVFAEHWAKIELSKLNFEYMRCKSSIPERILSSQHRERILPAVL
jgi:hypothetical protein